MDFVIAVGDDWQGAYLDGFLLTQNHSVSAVELLRSMDGYRVKEGRLTVKVMVYDEDWLSEVGGMPESLSDVKFVGAAQ